MSMRSFTVYDMFERNARIFRDAAALVTAAGERITFGRLLERVDVLAAGMAAQGIVKDDRIAVLALNHHRFFDLFGAAAALGVNVVPVNWRLSQEEIGYILSDASPKMLFVDAAHAEMAKTLAWDTLRLFTFDAGDAGLPAMEDLYGKGPTVPVLLEDDDAFCTIYTAAVEGKPRGAVLSHGNVIAANTQIAAAFQLTPTDAYLNMLPLFHITGLNLALSTLHVGGKNVVVEKFDEKQTLERIASEKISLLGSFPPILSRLVSELDAGDDDVSSLRHVLGLDGPDNIRPFQEKTGATFWILYGQTETSGLVTFSPALERPGAAGRQGLLSKVKLVDEAENEVEAGGTGEIVVQGPLVFKGYWNQEDLNRRTFRNGWHHTGDLGRLDEDGYLWFAGRKPEKELIKPGGENVYPAEVEEVVLRHPDVAEVSVIGVPDPQFGEGIKAICVLKPGAALAAADLMEFVASRIARYKKPRYVEFVVELPKKPDGAVDRAQVKTLYGRV